MLQTTCVTLFTLPRPAESYSPINLVGITPLLYEQNGMNVTLISVKQTKQNCIISSHGVERRQSTVHSLISLPPLVITEVCITMSYTIHIIMLSVFLGFLTTADVYFRLNIYLLRLRIINIFQ